MNRLITRLLVLSLDLGSLRGLANPRLPPAVDSRPAFTDSEKLAAGVDIVGLRLGMTPAEAREILEKRARKVIEHRATIEFSRSGALSPVAFPATSQLLFIEAVEKNEKPSEAEKIFLQFTPGPTERLLSILRYAPIQAAQREVSRQATLAKYGPSDKSEAGKSWWHFGKHLVADCEKYGLLGEDLSIATAHWSPKILVREAEPAMVAQKIRECGAAWLSTEIYYEVFDLHYEIRVHLFSLGLALEATDNIVVQGKAILARQYDGVVKAPTKPDL